MNELLQRHGCSNVFTIPEGLKELMADISREVLRDQPPKIFDYIANYLSVLLITREHGILAVKILDDLCDCRPSVSEHLIQLGMEKTEASMLSEIIKEEVEGFEPEEGKETVKETQILKKVLARTSLDEQMAAEVCQVARNAYRDYWYKKKLMEKHMQVHPNEPWEKAAQRTLEIYKKTKPSYSELTRATQKIQAAYRGYHVRRNILHPPIAKKRTKPKVEIPGPPLDIAGSREIDLGPVINLQVREEDAAAQFDEVVGQALNLKYGPMKTITHVPDKPLPTVPQVRPAKSDISRKSITPVKSISTTPSMVKKSTIRGMDEEEPVLDQPPSEVPLTDYPVVEKRRSRFTEPEKEPSRASSKVVGSATPSVGSAKISFAGLDEPKKGIADQEAQAEDIPKADEAEIYQTAEVETSKPDEAEVPQAAEEIPKTDETEILQATEAETPKSDEARILQAAEGEIPEELPAPAETGPEDVPEVPEDIPTDSAPEAYDSAAEADDSAAEATDSAPLSSAPVTDVDTGGEEEGE